MIILLSPAKTLDMKNQDKTKLHTIPRLLERSEIIADIMKGYSPSRLVDLMGISLILARTNAERYINWELPFTTDNAKQSILAFSGEVYRGLNVASFTQQDLKLAQKHIRILSGLYGVL